MAKQINEKSKPVKLSVQVFYRVVNALYLTESSHTKKQQYVSKSSKSFKSKFQAKNVCKSITYRPMIQITKS